MASATELRTFLFADIRGYTSFTQQQGDRAAAELAARFAALIREGVIGRGGDVLELRGDGALAVFGSARQALWSAIDLQERFRREREAESRLRLNVGIGLDAGEAVPVEGGYRGGALNLAARLADLANASEVLASEEVAHLARRTEGLAYVERGAVHLKGFADPVRVVQVVPEDAGRTSQTDAASEAEAPMAIGGFLGALPPGPLVGREQDLKRILGAADAVAGGSGRLVMLSGEPGIGKTRLAQEIGLELRNREFLVSTGRSYEPQSNVAFYPFLEALAGLYRSAPASIRDDSVRRWPHLARLLPEQVDAAKTEMLDDQEGQQQLFRAVAAFVASLAETAPVAVLLDDLHWTDSASLELLQHLARQTRAHRVLLLGTYRDVEVEGRHRLERALADLNREQLLDRVVIGGLEKSDSTDLVQRTIGQVEDLSELTRLIHARTEGNPFFLQEVVRALIERGDIYRQNGHWAHRQISEIVVPESVRFTIGERFSRLSAQSQETLREASALGPRFGFDELRELVEGKESEVEAALTDALKANLLREVTADQYEFIHALTQQALYSDLTLRQRRRLHLRAGEILESRGQELRGSRAADLAWHFLHADDLARALPYSLAAGDQAEQVFAHQDAEQHYRTALRLASELDDIAQQAQALEKVGSVLTITGRYPEALELLTQALELYRGTAEIEAEVRVAVYIARALHESGKPQEAAASLRALINQLEPAGPSVSLARLYVAYSSAATALRSKEAFSVAERATEVAKSAGDMQLLAEAEFNRGRVLQQQLGRLDEGREALEKATSLAESTRDDFLVLPRALTFLGFDAAARGQLKQAGEYFQRAAEIGETTGSAFAGMRMLGCSEFFMYLGDLKQAKTFLERAAQAPGAEAVHGFKARSATREGHLALVEGDWKNARADLEEALRSLETESVQELELKAEVRWLLGELNLEEGKVEQARQILEPSLRTNDPDIARVLAAHASSCLRLGKIEQAAESIKRGLVESEQDRVHRPDVLRVQAMLLATKRQWAKAERAFGEAVTLAREMPYPYAEGRALYEWGLMLLQKGEQTTARARLEEALTVFNNLGARTYARRAEEALEKLQATSYKPQARS